MTVLATVFTATYRARGYDDDDAALLRSELEQFGAVRLRPLQLPEAGGSHELSIVIDFVGTAAASGLIGHIATRYYDRLAAALGRFFDKKSEKDFAPEMSILVTYDDIDLHIGPVTRGTVADLQQLAGTVHSHLQKAALRDKSIFKIVIGMIHYDDEWSEPHLQEWPENHRYWGISFEGHRMLTHIYDSETGLLSEANFHRPGW